MNLGPDEPVGEELVSMNLGPDEPDGEELLSILHDPDEPVGEEHNSIYSFRRYAKSNAETTARQT